MKYVKPILLVLIFILVAGGAYYFISDKNKNKAVDLVLNTPIAEVLQNPQDYSEKVTHISGVVTSSMNLGIKIYTLNDGTGAIIILTEKAVPKEKSEVYLKGKVKQYFKILDKEMTVFIEEKEQLSN
ncbi:MAG: hypothetical protein IPN14_04020 [Bacteroidetes bacterium]|nr:hypothetical protein [Bacteroidota bacterium]